VPRGKTARARLPIAELTPQVLALTARGLTVRKIGDELGIGETSVRKIKKLAAASGQGTVIIPNPVLDHDLLDARYQLMLGCRDLGEGHFHTPTPGGFRDFFDEFSGHVLPDHCFQWVCDAMGDGGFSGIRLLINCPPRHAKSKVFTVWMPIFRVVIDRDVQCLLVSQTEELAKKFAREIAYHLEYNRPLLQAFGRFKGQNADEAWRPNSGMLLVAGRRRDIKMGDMTIQVRGSGQQILGMEADLIIGDDPVSRRNSATEGERMKLSEWWHGDVMTRLTPDGDAYVIGQRLHHQDLYGELAAKRKTRVAGAPELWRHINYPAVRNWTTQEVLWPEVWSFDRLMEKYEDITSVHGTALWESMYQQNPIPPEARTVRPEWVYGSDVHIGCLDRHRRLGQAATALEGEQFVRVASLDPSPTRATGLVVGDLLSSRDRFYFVVMETLRDRLDVRGMIRELTRMVIQYGFSYLIVEINAAQRWFLQDPEFRQWQLRYGVRGIPHTTHRNKADPDYGVGSLAGDFEFGRVRFPYGNTDAIERTDLMIDELITHPFGAYDDQFMALWFVKYNFARLTPPGTSHQMRDGDRRGGPYGYHVPARLEKGYAWMSS